MELNTNTDTMFWEEKYKTQQQMEENKKKENMFKLLEVEFPNIKETDLVEQSATMRSNDGCIHYLHVATEQIYSWNKWQHKWRRGTDKSLMVLFKK